MTTNASDTITRQCSKCRGAGRISAFANVAAGVCFACNGAGSFTTTVAAERKRIAAGKRRDAKRAAAEADRAATFAARRLADWRDALANGWTVADLHDEVCACRFSAGAPDLTRPVCDRFLAGNAAMLAELA